MFSRLGHQAYDSHCNLVLGDVEETIYVVEEDADEQEVVRVWSLRTIVLLGLLSFVNDGTDGQEAVGDAVRERYVAGIARRDLRVWLHGTMMC